MHHNVSTTKRPGKRRAHPASAPCSNEFYELAHLSTAELEREILRGFPPRLDSLIGWEFRGLNTPAWAGILGIRKFIKGFYCADGAPLENHPRALGYNIPAVQNPIYGSWIALPEDSRPKRFGFYEVAKPDPTARDNAYLHALLLDYSKHPAHRLRDHVNPMHGLRDYLVQVDRENDGLLLGKAYYALGPLRLGVSYFLLERHRPAPARASLVENQPVENQPVENQPVENH